MARTVKKALPQIRYPIGPLRIPPRVTLRTYPYRFRQTSSGRVPTTQDDILPFLTSRIAKHPAGEQPRLDA